MRKRSYLHDNWNVKPGNLPQDIQGYDIPLEKIKRFNPATVPGTVHTDLLNADLIEDPFYGDNENHLQWIDDTDWTYKTTFDFPSDFEPDKSVELVFAGLDTFSEIFLNDKNIGLTQNMFKQYRFDITTIIKEKGNNLEIRFQAARKQAAMNRSDILQFPSARHPDRAFIRKSQYSFGWDWGPAFPTTGIWRPVYLMQPERAWIDSVRFNTIRLEDQRANVQVNMNVGGVIQTGWQVKVILSDDSKSFTEERTINTKDGMVVNWDINRPQLWWPNGMGIPYLYQLDVHLLDAGGHLIDRWQKEVGIRTISLQLEDEGKKTFRFIVNGKKIFIRGANWIPADSFLPRIKENDYLELLTLAGDAHMNMIRVWGGGIYENDIFYQYCDKLGLMVWQDFMFACAAYPENKAFIDEIKDEVEQNVLKLQHHPSIAIWCGNNENEWIWSRDEQGTYKNMPGYNIFHKEIPKIVSALDPLRPYWPTSPYGDEEDPNDPASGNRHAWDIWSRWIDYTEVTEDKSLFVTEFGFQGPANIDTINSVLDKEDREVQSELFEFHNKQSEGNERLFRFLAGHLPVRTEWEDFIYLAQLNQGLALKTCLEHWRSRWPETAGSIIWQLNDCWPVASWSLIDSHLNPKLSYFFVKGIFSDPALYIKKEGNQIKTMITNESKENFSGQLEYSVLNLLNSQDIKNEKKDITVQKGEKKSSETISIDELPESGNWIYITTLYDKQGYIYKRNYYTLKKWKHLKMSPSDINITRSGEDKLSIETNSLALFVDLYHDVARFSDRGFIMLPGEKKDLEILSGDLEKFEFSNVRIFTLNDYLH